MTPHETNSAGFVIHHHYSIHPFCFTHIFTYVSFTNNLKQSLGTREHSTLQPNRVNKTFHTGGYYWAYWPATISFRQILTSRIPRNCLKSRGDVARMRGKQDCSQNQQTNGSSPTRLMKIDLKMKINNSSTPERFEQNFRYLIFKLISVTDG